MSDFAVIITKKESGVTSFQSLSPIKKIYKGSKVGQQQGRSLRNP